MKTSLIAKALLLSIVVSILAVSPLSAQEYIDNADEILQEEIKTDSIAAPGEVKKKMNIFQKIGAYFKGSNKEPVPGKFDITFIGGPHFSDEKGFGIGVLAAALYRPDYQTPPSNISLFGDVATVGFYEIGVMGNHITRNDKSRLNYQFYFYSFPSYFWGIGFQNGFRNTATKYDKLQAQLTADWVFRISKNLYAGPAIELSYISADNPKIGEDKPNPWEGYSRTTYSYGVGGVISFDTRDNLTAPNKGMFARAAFLGFPGFIGNKYPFANVELTYAFYCRLWKGGVLASRLHGMFSIGKTVPWGLLPTFGGSYNMRGYYQGRYCDRNEADLTFELRQHLWRRNGLAVWVGAGEVFHSFKDINLHDVLPTWGLGYRWEFKKNVNIRIDVGFGRQDGNKKTQMNFIFSLNEAF